MHGLEHCSELQLTLTLLLFCMQLLKGYVYEISTGVKLQVPKDDRSSLGLVQPYLLIQLELSMVGHAVTLVSVQRTSAA